LPKGSKTSWGGTILKRQAGTLLLELMQPAALTDIFGRIVRWQRLNKKGEAHDVDCPPQVAITYRSRTGAWGLPVLGGIISAPLLRPDGTVLHRAGYDPATGLFLTEEWPAVDSSPTRDDALMALALIVETFGQFPFVTEADRCVFVAAILTALQRRLLASAPLFAFSAPTQRTGKSLLAECLAIIATGKEAPAMAVKREPRGTPQGRGCCADGGSFDRQPR
jgi:putative DNA primase/helicase